jgi:hypothetical protein
MMTWYAAHIIMSVRLKERRQTRFPVWENVVLIKAESADEAFDKAEEIGKRDEGDDDGSFRWGGHAATWVFAGVRKLTECATMNGRPQDGEEVSFIELELDSLRAVKRLAAGESVTVRYNDRFPDEEAEPVKQPKPAKRKGA